MMFVAIIIYACFNRVPKWLLKEKYKELEYKFSRKIPIFKLTGFVLSILLAFLLTFGITKATKDKFIENKNAIYGFEFNSTMEELGFQDSMKIKTINGEGIDRVSDIYGKIFLKHGEIEVVVEKSGIQSKVILSEADKFSIIQNIKATPLIPIMYDSNGENEIIITTKNYGFSDVLDIFRSLIKQAVLFINPNLSPHQGHGEFGVIIINKNDRSFLMDLSLNLMILGILNLLPLPGFSIGNFAVSVIETFKKKQFNKRRKLVIGWISIFFIIGILILRMII